jgi:large subunit ribosomal protein L25
MERLSLSLNPRTITGKKVKQLRKQGLVPASICGRGVQTEIFQVDVREFNQIYRHAGRTGLIDLRLPDGTRSAFIRQVQRNPVNDQYIHVDFRIVDLTVEITADIPIVAVGENRLVEQNQGVLSMPHATLHVRGLPADLPQVVEVDVSRLEDFHQVIHVSDLDLGSTIEVLTPGEEVVATLTPSTTEADQEAVMAEEMPEETAAAAVEQEAEQAAEESEE